MSRTLATAALIGVTAVWGWTFVVVHDAVAIYGVLAFLGARFGLAAAATGLLWGRRLDRRTLRVGAVIGLVLAMGYLFQTWGLRHTTPTNSGLITGLFVIFAPVIDRLLYGARMLRLRWLAIVLSLAGMVLLTGRIPTGLAIGDLLTLVCAIWLGAHTALLSHHAPDHDPRALATAQMLAMAAVFLVMWPLAGKLQPPPREVWFAIVVTGIVASALAFVVQSAAQQHLPTSRAVILLTTEPLFAGLFGYLLAGDRLSELQVAGAVLILGAVVLSEVVPMLVAKR